MPTPLPTGWLTAAVGDYRLQGRTLSQPQLAVVALAVAFAGLLPRRLWRWGRLGVTAVHEGGHAVAARLVGRRVVAVHLRADTSGVTYHAGSAGRISRLVTTVAGYPAPGLLAVAGAALCATGRPRAWLGLLAALAAIGLLLWVRNLFGVVIVLAGAGGLGWLAIRGTSGLDALVGATLAWYLAAGGLRSVIEANRQSPLGRCGGAGPVAPPAAGAGHRRLHRGGGGEPAADRRTAARRPVAIRSGAVRRAARHRRPPPRRRRR